MKINLWGERMKKYLILGILLLVCCFTGCGKYSESDIVKDLTKNIENAKAYQLEGELEIINNDDSYHYDVTVAYKQKDMYKVSLKNKANNHEQIILKNSDGVYVLTPSLNKSFKFQSDWPYNNSQIYLLQSILNDIKNDDSRTFKEEGKTYTFVTSVNYPNNRKLVKQKITMDKDLKFQTIEVLDDTDVPQMKMTFHSIDMNPSFDDNYFILDEIMKSASIEEEVKETSSIEDVIYPLYIPSGTKLADQDVVEKTDGERVIMSFDGEKPFLLVEETVNKEDEFTIIPTYGEPYMLVDTVGALTDNSLTWTSNGIEYYLVSDVMNQLELIEIAQSINVIPTMK